MRTVRCSSLYPREQNDWQTGVKTLPCRNFIADGNNQINAGPG